MTGADAPLDSCTAHTFNGRLVSSEGGVWTLDTCPCDTECLEPDPYVLTLTVPDASQLPSPVACPRVELGRNFDTCEPSSLVIRNLKAGDAPRWIAGKGAGAPSGLFTIGVAPVMLAACNEVLQYALKFTVQNTSLTLGQGEFGMLSEGAGHWKIQNYKSVATPEGPEFAWVMTR